MYTQFFQLGLIAELFAREYELDVCVSPDSSLRSWLTANPVKEYTHLSHKSKIFSTKSIAYYLAYRRDF